MDRQNSTTQETVDSVLRTCEVLVIGAGPAGMAAAVEAGKSGLSVIVLGDQWSPGGQVYRAIERAHPERLKTLGPDYRNAPTGSRRLLGNNSSGSE